MILLRIFLVIFVFLRIFLIQIRILCLRVINLALVFDVSSIEFIRSWRKLRRSRTSIETRRRCKIILERNVFEWIRSRCIVVDVLICIERWSLSSVNVILIREEFWIKSIKIKINLVCVIRIIRIIREKISRLISSIVIIDLIISLRLSILWKSWCFRSIISKSLIFRLIADIFRLIVVISWILIEVLFLIVNEEIIWIFTVSFSINKLSSDIFLIVQLRQKTVQFDVDFKHK
jgi:hypothetical protein